ncbi:multidrug effflux MFS transporter [Micromonospora sp. DT81.3]|uniref:multidrug effflux MFS transporter n=1 Tax=Micromonospora sp. DT81.3 TaxID=3416523 RepID=UPI003CF3303F
MTAPLTLALGVMAATGPLSLDAYLPALPTMATEFGVSPQVIQLSLSACLLGLGVGQLFAGPLGDRFGRRIPMVIGAALYVLASLGCALAPDAVWLIAFRAIQGLAGAVGLVLSRAVVRDITSGNTATRLYSQMAAVSGAAPVVAPVAGALLIGAAGWRAVFVALALLGIGMMLLAQFVIRETHPRNARTSAAVIPVLHSYGHLLRDRTFLGYMVVVLFTAAILFSYISSAPFVLQNVFGLTELGFALCFAAVGGGLVVVSLLNARLVRRHGARVTLPIASAVQLLGIIALGALIVVRMTQGWSSIPLLVVCLLWAVTPCGAITPTCVSLAMARGGNRAGSASALLGTSMFLVGGLVSPISGGVAPAIAMVVLMLIACCAGLVGILVVTRRGADPESSTAD